MGTIICRPADPEAKGVVERAIRYLETSFLSGRSFEDPHDFNAQLSVWLRGANQRVHRVLRCRPSERIAEDRAAMLGFPPVLPDPALAFGVRLGRDHYVRVGTCDYSVHPKVIGRRVEVRVDLDWVTISCDGIEVGRHQRSWTKHRTVTDAGHARARQRLREQAQRPSAPDEVEVQERDLGDYDRALGVA